jgi:hypothetical protein
MFEDYSVGQCVEKYIELAQRLNAYNDLGIADISPVEIVTKQIDALKVVIAKRRRETLELELARAQARLESLKTRDQKRTETEALIESLRKQLG